MYFEPAAVIVALVLLGQVLELRARSRTGAAIRNLLGLAPKTARRSTRTAAKQDVPLEQVQRRRSAARPAGREESRSTASCSKARATVDESMVTGEPIPVEKTAAANGDRRHGERHRHVRDAGRASRQRHAARADRAHGRRGAARRAPIQRLADAVSGWFVPAVVAVAVVTFVVWAIFGPEPRLAHALVNAVAVLIIACPCALGLATPMSIMVGTGRGARRRAVRNAEALEVLEKVDTLVVDKTGTLTEGKPKLCHVEPIGRASNEDTLLRLAASLERVQRASAGRGHRRRRARARHRSCAGVDELRVGHRARA